LPFNVLDLGAEWTDMTGLPMVFAVWAGPKQSLRPGLGEAFDASYSYGRDHMEEIVAEQSRKRGIPASLARQYLTRHIAFELGDRELEGMRLFLGYAGELHERACSKDMMA